MELRRITAGFGFELIDNFASQFGAGEDIGRPIDGVRFEVVSEIADGNTVLLPAPMEMQMVRSPSGVHAFTGLVRRRMADRPVRLPDGEYEGRIVSAAHQRTSFKLPRASSVAGSQKLSVVTLEPGYRYRLPRALPNLWAAEPTMLRGVVHGADGAGLEDCVVSTEAKRKKVEGRDPADIDWRQRYRTDESGQWLLFYSDAVFDPTSDRTPRTKDVKVWVRYPDAQVGPFTVTLSQGGTHTLSETALRGFVFVSGRPVERATIDVAGFDARSSTASDGSWPYYFRLGAIVSVQRVSVRAVLPDGREQTKTVDAVPEKTTTVESFEFSS